MGTRTRQVQVTSYNHTLNSAYGNNYTFNYFTFLFYGPVIVGPVTSVKIATVTPAKRIDIQNEICMTASLEILECLDQPNIVYQAVKSTHYTCMDLRNCEYVYT